MLGKLVVGVQVHVSVAQAILMRLLFDEMQHDVFTYDFSSCFFPKFKKFDRKGFFARNDLFFWFLRHQNTGGGSSYPNVVQKYQKP